MSDSSKEFPENFSEESLALPLIKSTMLNKAFECPNFSDSVISQFSDDLNNPIPCQYDFEFISTYFDNQLFNDFKDQNLLQQRMQTFEQHLPNCALCNEQLGQLLTLTDICRNYWYNFEKQLETMDFSGQVMQHLSSHSPFEDVLDESVPLQISGCGLYTHDTIFALHDNELTSKEAKELENHIQKCTPCKNIYSVVVNLNDTLKAFYGHLLQNEKIIAIPGYWALISDKLTKDLNLSNVREFSSSKKQQTLFKITAAAASILFVFLAGGLFMQHSQPNIDKKPVNIALLEEAIIEDRQEIASRQSGYPQGNQLAVIYQSPEAYLFSAKADNSFLENIPPVNEMQAIDVSEFVLNDSPY